KSKHYYFFHPDVSGFEPGVKTEKDFEEILRQARDVIADDIRQLRTADIRALPKHQHACSNCSYAGSCGFENWKYYQ
ncbi:MAG: PD-(D/E)XK nuclease family protein, partial [Candidatus Omnitrophica bacterium]|nr:PD-(D/E)XK nuclease family protein [Candidatus Omnitrophota bacterium]